jgi:hypothetical protein
MIERPRGLFIHGSRALDLSYRREHLRWTTAGMVSVPRYVTVRWPSRSAPQPVPPRTSRTRGISDPSYWAGADSHLRNYLFGSNKSRLASSLIPKLLLAEDRSVLTVSELHPSTHRVAAHPFPTSTPASAAILSISLIHHLSWALLAWRSTRLAQGWRGCVSENDY